MSIAFDENMALGSPINDLKTSQESSGRMGCIALDRTGDQGGAVRSSCKEASP